MHNPPMITKLLCVSALLITTGLSEVPAPVEDLLRQGLFEEEANRDFDKAAERYRAVVAAHDKQRAFAATATFRLGEIARKKNDKEAAAAAFRTVAERFPEQEDLARMSRENLAALGMALENPSERPSVDPFAESPPEDPEDKEIERLKNIARDSPDLLDGATDIGWRPLHVAAANGQEKVIAYLLGNKADPNSRTTREQLTPLQIAAVHGRLNAVAALLAAKARIDETVSLRADTGKELPPRDTRADKAWGDWTALDLAILYDRREVVRMLVKAGADLKTVTTSLSYPQQGSPPTFNPRNEFAPLSLAIRLQREDIARFLIESGAPLDAGGVKVAEPPLMLAIRHLPSLVPVLLKAGADVGMQGGQALDTPLHLAAMGGKVALARMLIDGGADPNAGNRTGQTPLHWAGSGEMVEFLVSKGADPNAKDNEGLAPLDAATTGANFAEPVQQFEALLKSGAVVADEKDLLLRATPVMAQVVCRKLVYPKLQGSDRVLVSCSVASVQGNSVGANWVRPLEIRPAAGSPTPSVIEACRLIPAVNYPLSLGTLKIVRREGEADFRTVFEWSPGHDERLDMEFPSLEWGDILEFSFANRGRSPLGSFEDLLPDRKVTIRMGGHTFVRSLTESGSFWLGDTNAYFSASSSAPRTSPMRTRRLQPTQSQPVPSAQPVRAGKASVSYLPVVPDFVDSSRILVTRKGVADQIAVDLLKTDIPPFRLIEGDLIDLVLKDSIREDLHTNSRQLVLTTDFKLGGVVNNIGLLASVSTLVQKKSAGDRLDCTDVRILRGGDPGRTEHFNFEEILPENIFTQAANRETFVKWDRLEPGDWILVPFLAPEADEKRVAGALALMDRTRIAGEVMSRPVPQPVEQQARPRVTPPPQPR